MPRPRDSGSVSLHFCLWAGSVCLLKPAGSIGSRSLPPLWGQGGLSLLSSEQGWYCTKGRMNQQCTHPHFPVSVCLRMPLGPRLEKAVTVERGCTWAVVALAAAQARILGGEQNSFFLHMQPWLQAKIGKRAAGGCPGAVPWSKGWRRMGHQMLGEEAALHKAEFRVAKLALQRLWHFAGSTAQCCHCHGNFCRPGWVHSPHPKALWCTVAHWPHPVHSYSNIAVRFSAGGCCKSCGGDVWFRT